MLLPMRAICPAKFLWPALGASIFTLPGCQTGNLTSRPNIILILADDLGYGDLTCLNPTSRIATPHLDRLASEGIIFTNAHSPSAVSSPTRYGVLTGRYCFHTSLKSGVLNGYSSDLIGPGRKTIADLATQAGYHTACIGKWHLGLDWPRLNNDLPLIDGDGWAPASTSNVDYHGLIGGGPLNHGFDYSFIIPASLDMVPYCYIRNGRLTAPVSGQIQGSDSPRGVFWRKGDIQQGFNLGTTLDVLTDEALDFIRNKASATNPFFLYLPLTSPHTPWLPSEKFRGTSGAGTYGDFVAQTDNCVGRIMLLLEELNLDHKTLVIFTSDNGSNWTPSDILKWDHLSNGSFRGQKSDVWEGGHHVPFLAYWKPVIKRGQLCAATISLADFFDTFSELFNMEEPMPGGEDSYSFLGLLQDPGSSTDRKSVVTHSINGMFAIQAGNWKYIDGRGSGGWSDSGDPLDPPGQLYDLWSDKGETSNLFNEYPDKVMEMKGLLDSTKQLPSILKIHTNK